MIYESVKVPESEIKPYSFRKEDGIVGLMDCGGSNIVKLNEQMPGIIKIIGTGRIDNPKCKAREKAEQLKVPLVELDFRDEEKKLGMGVGDYLRAITYGREAKLIGKLDYDGVINARTTVCNDFLKLLNTEIVKKGIKKGIPAFGAGFMQILSSDFIDNFGPVFNVHPGDLTKYDIRKEFDSNQFFRKGRNVVGDAWIPSAIAILSGHENLYSSLHIMTDKMDEGAVFMRGYPLPIDYNKLLSKVDITDKVQLKLVSSYAQEALKYLGDHVIAGAVFSDLFDGKYGIHKSGVLAYKFYDDWFLAPNGIGIQDHVVNNSKTIFRRENNFINGVIDDFYKNVDTIKVIK